LVQSVPQCRRRVKLLSWLRLFAWRPCASSDACSPVAMLKRLDSSRIAWQLPLLPSTTRRQSPSGSPKIPKLFKPPLQLFQVAPSADSCVIATAASQTDRLRKPGRQSRTPTETSRKLWIPFSALVLTSPPKQTWKHGKLPRAATFFVPHMLSPRSA